MTKPSLQKTSPSLLDLCKCNDESLQLNLRRLTDDELHESTISAAEREREEMINLLKHLSEVERRHLYSKFKTDSLHAYCVKYLQMSQGEAGRNVSASRLLYELPVIEEKVRVGSMTLTSVCQANTFFRKEAVAGNKLEREEKLELIAELEGQSTRMVEKILISKTDQPDIHLKETVKQKTEKLTEVKMLIDEETLDMLNRLKEIQSHEMPNATYAQIVKKVAKLGLEKLDPDLKAKRAVERKAKITSKASLTPKPLKPPIIETAPAQEYEASKTKKLNETAVTSTPAAEREVAIKISNKKTRYIPAAVKHAVWMRDKGRCTFTDPKTGECCDSRKFVECDHIVPFAHGGEHSLENLRLRCRTHNQRHTIETFCLIFLSPLHAPPPEWMSPRFHLIFWFSKLRSRSVFAD